MTLGNIKYFEANNNLPINVYSYDKEIFPVYVSKNVRFKKINLLLYKGHFFLITKFNRLMNEKNGLHHYCCNCLVGFQRVKTLTDHMLVCLNNKFQKLTLPTEETAAIKFTSYHKMLRHPFCAFADFECLTKKVHSV